MRCFHVTVKDDEIKCNPDKFHVPPYTHEDIGVCLDTALLRKYALKIDLGEDTFLKQETLNSSMVVLHDYNSAPDVGKFTISLTGPRGGRTGLTPLDPHVVND